MLIKAHLGQQLTTDADDNAYNIGIDFNNDSDLK